MKEEDQLQVECMRYIRLQYPYSVSFHVRNEGIRGTPQQRMAYGSKSKRMGVLSGVSDIIILEPNKHFHGLIIELKAKKGIVSPTQKLFLARTSAKGYSVHVSRTFDEVKFIVDKYMAEK